jgi:ketosteroid isomerase-like protein
MRTLKLLSRATAAATLAALLPTTTAYSTAPPPEPKAQVTRAVSLVGTDLHLPGGKVVPLPSQAGRYPVLLGTSRRGWVVASGRSFRLVRPDGTVRRITHRNNDDLYVTEALSDDGRRVVSASFDQGDSFNIRVVGVGGKVTINTFFEQFYVDVMDADDGKVYLGGRAGLWSLDERTDQRTRLLRRPTALVDLEHDTVFVGTRKRRGRVGPTSLTDPGTPRWRARSVPVAVSPDGAHVVNDDGTVRAMADGRVVRRVPAPGRRDEFHFLGWASARRVLVEPRADGHRVLLSCPLPRGACRRVGSTNGRVSVPTSHGGPYLMP